MLIVSVACGIQSDVIYFQIPFMRNRFVENVFTNKKPIQWLNVNKD